MGKGGEPGVGGAVSGTQGEGNLQEEAGIERAGSGVSKVTGTQHCVILAIV